jgi:hypothetical protein
MKSRRHGCAVAKTAPGGSSHTTVVRNGYNPETYTSRYQLKFIGFHVMDENEDGINEPGEPLHVTDIQVQNTGTSNTQY